MQIRLCFAIISILVGATSALPLQRPPDIKLTAAINREVIEGVLKAINAYYVSPETAKKIEVGIHKRVSDGAYEKITSAFDLVHALNKDLQELSKDKHIYMGYSFEPQVFDHDPQTDTPEERQGEFRQARDHNFGFEKLERLPGNIGYLDLRRFDLPVFSGGMTTAAMTLLANTDALILDLRSNRGGAPVGMIFFASYFFDDEPVYLGSTYFRPANKAGHRPENSTVQYWTYPFMPGPRYLDKDVYILTSKRTWSAAEAFAKRLQALKRVLIIGQPTLGGNNPGLFITIHPHFAVFVPTGKPIETSDSEGGVTPDIEVPADQALKRAHLEAVMKKASRDPNQKEQLDALINTLKKELEGLSPKQ